MAIKIIDHGGSIASTVKLIGSGTLVLHKNAKIREYSIIEMNDGILEIGESSILGYYNFVQCTGTIKIGKGVLIGPQTVILASSHPISDKPFVGAGLTRGTIIMEDDIWIGANVTIGWNTTINSKAIIGANSFVNRDIPSGQIWGGNPVKYIKLRE